MPFALAPLLLITLSVLGLLGSETQVRLIAQIEQVIGTQAAEAVNLVIEGADERPDLTKIGGVIGFVLLAFSASSVFAQIQSSLNRIWDAPPLKGLGVWIWFKHRLLSMGMVLSVGQSLRHFSLWENTLLFFIWVRVRWVRHMAQQAH